MSTIEKTPSEKEHDDVVAFICKNNKDKFTVLNNLGIETNHVAGLYPDIIIKNKIDDGSYRFIIEVKKNGGIAPCLQQWKNTINIPCVLYIIVPEEDLPNARKIAGTIGMQVKFGSYKIEESIISVKYE